MTGRSAATAPERPRLSVRFSARDLVNVAIFAGGSLGSAVLRKHFVRAGLA